MWGTWFLLLASPLLVFLLVVGIAFGTSALLFPVLIAAAVLVVVGVIYGARRPASKSTGADARSPESRDKGAPASGEGSRPEPPEPPPWQAPWVVSSTTSAGTTTGARGRLRTWLPALRSSPTDWAGPTVPSPAAPRCSGRSRARSMASKPMSC